MGVTGLKKIIIRTKSQTHVKPCTRPKHLRFLDFKDTVIFNKHSFLDFFEPLKLNFYIEKYLTPFAHNKSN